MYQEILISNIKKHLVGKRLREITENFDGAITSLIFRFDDNYYMNMSWEIGESPKIEVSPAELAWTVTWEEGVTPRHQEVKAMDIGEAFKKAQKILGNHPIIDICIGGLAR